MDDDPLLGTFKMIVGFCNTLDSFNRFVLPLMKQETAELKRYAADIAKHRGYVANKEKGCYE